MPMALLESLRDVFVLFCTFGDPANTTPGCTQPDGYTADASDCDDTNLAIYPGSTELCDLADNDCDGVLDEDDAADAPLWYRDADGDGFGDPAMGVPSCGGFEGYWRRS